MASPDSSYSGSGTSLREEISGSPAPGSFVGPYEIVKTLGTGTFAVVVLGRHGKTGDEVAIKVVKKATLSPTQLEKLYREVRIMRKLKHPHIIQLYDVLETSTHLLLVTEYASGGELYDHLIVKGAMREREARAMFLQLFSAVLYCHQQRVIHRDLKPENILFDSRMRIKLADFGFSNQYNPTGSLETYCGTPMYAAPELFQGRKYTGPEVDMWSLGVILFAMVTSDVPFDGTTVGEIRKRVCSGIFEIPSFISTELKELLRRMIVMDMAKRRDLRNLFDSKWLNADGDVVARLEAIHPLIDPRKSFAALDARRSALGLDKRQSAAALAPSTQDAPAPAAAAATPAPAPAAPAPAPAAPAPAPAEDDTAEVQINTADEAVCAPLDNDIVAQICRSLRVSEHEVLESLRNNIYDDLTAMYTILWNRKYASTHVNAPNGTVMSPSDYGSSSNDDRTTDSSEEHVNNATQTPGERTPETLSPRGTQPSNALGMTTITADDAYVSSANSPHPEPDADVAAAASDAKVAPSKSMRRASTVRPETIGFAASVAGGAAGSRPISPAMMRTPPMSPRVTDTMGVVSRATGFGSTVSSPQAARKGRRRSHTVDEQQGRPMIQPPASATSTIAAAAAVLTPAADAPSSPPRQRPASIACDASVVIKPGTLTTMPSAAVQSRAATADISTSPSSWINARLKKRLSGSGFVTTPPLAAALPTPSPGRLTTVPESSKSSNDAISTTSVRKLSFDVGSNEHSGSSVDGGSSISIGGGSNNGGGSSIGGGSAGSSASGSPNMSPASKPRRLSVVTAFNMLRGKRKDKEGSLSPSGSHTNVNEVAAKPRALKFTWSSSTTSTKTAAEIGESIVQTCRELRASCDSFMPFTYRVRSVDCQLEVEICVLPRMQKMHGLRIKRTGGRSHAYKAFTEQFLGRLKL